MRPADIPKPSLPSVLPKKPPPSKTSSSPFSLPPRRPDRPPSLASVHPHPHKLVSFLVGVGGSSRVVAEVRGLTMLYGLPARCDSPKSEAGSFTSDSALDRSHDGGEFEMKACGFGGWQRAHFTALCLCRVKRCLIKLEFLSSFFSLNCGCHLQTSTWMLSSCRQKSLVIPRRRGHESPTAGLARRSSHQ